MINTKMSFGVPQVRDFLKYNGYVLTVRGYDYNTGSARVPNLDNIMIKRVKVCEIKLIDDLDNFVPLSGFGTAAEWWIQIRRFCKGKMYLYRVTLDEDIPELTPTRESPQRSLFIDEPEMGFTADRHKFRSDYGSTSTEEYNIYDDQSHSLDIRDDPALTDPALVDLQPFKDAAHTDRLQRDRRRAERREGYMRTQQGQITKTISWTERKTAIEAHGKPDVLMVTGNRKLHDPAAIRIQLSDLIDEHRPDIAISGMATGTDQIFAEICIEKGIPLHAYIPFSGQETRWSVNMQKRYRELLTHCEKKVIVCDAASKQAFQDRNVAMVKAANRAIAVTDGKQGGTKNCIRVLKQTNTPHKVIVNRSEV